MFATFEGQQFVFRAVGVVLLFPKTLHQQHVFDRKHGVIAWQRFPNKLDLFVLLQVHLFMKFLPALCAKILLV